VGGWRCQSGKLEEAMGCDDHPRSWVLNDIHSCFPVFLIQKHQMDPIVDKVLIAIPTVETVG
jgi:hypothetical protein